MNAPCSNNLRSCHRRRSSSAVSNCPSRLQGTRCCGVARLAVVDFTEFALSQLPGPPRRVLEVGCGYQGGVAPALAAAGYDVLAIDPDAPEGPLYRAIALEELDDPGPFDAVVAGRVPPPRPTARRCPRQARRPRAAARPRRVRLEPHVR